MTLERIAAGAENTKGTVGPKRVAFAVALRLRKGGKIAHGSEYGGCGEGAGSF